MDLIDKAQALKALEEISYALWEIDIPSPTVPEYIEHHEGVQAVMEVADRWARKIQALPSARPKGKWTTRRTEYHDGEWWCTNCEQRCLETVMGKPRWKYCPYCGAEMENNNE